MEFSLIGGVNQVLNLLARILRLEQGLRPWSSSQKLRYRANRNIDITLQGPGTYCLQGSLTSQCTYSFDCPD